MTEPVPKGIDSKRALVVRARIDPCRRRFIESRPSWVARSLEGYAARIANKKQKRAARRR